MFNRMLVRTCACACLCMYGGRLGINPIHTYVQGRHCPLRHTVYTYIHTVTRDVHC